MKALHVRLTLATALLLVILSVALLALMNRTSEQYAAEVRQRLDSGIAMYVVRELPLLRAGKVNEAALAELANRAMTVNPSAEVYLLDVNGKVLSSGSRRLPLARPIVNLDPIRSFLRSPDQRPLFGDDPTSPTRQRVFSVSTIPDSGPLEGYLYVVLGGQPERSIAERLWGSYALRAGSSAMLFVVGLTIAAAAGLFFGLTRRLRRLEAAMDHWVQGMPAGALRQEVIENGGDEISGLSARFSAMSMAIEAQLKELKTTDDLRRELVANVSHDLRTPLASLRGYIETALVKAPHAKANELTTYLKVALRQAEQLGRLVEALFELARLESGTVSVQLEPVSIAELLQDVGMRFQLLAETAQIRLVTALDTSGILVFADVGLIERALSNLIENAIRHTPPAGEVRLEMRAKGGRVVVRVADTGSGIDANQLPRIFDRFKPSHLPRDRERTGLGLSIVKRIVDLHGQSLHLSSESNAGTTVEFTLDRVPATASPAYIASA